MPRKDLFSLFKDYPIQPAGVDVEVTGIAVDSRLVKSGDVFVATSDRVDGHQYIPNAIQNGAVAILGSKPLEGLSVPYIQVEDARLAMAHISAAFYDYPANDLTLIGVTGSDGKTTTVNFIYEILKAAGIKAGMVSTVKAVVGDHEMDTGLHVTTPEVFDGQRYLREMVDAGLTHAVMETTSHGLAARRALGGDFDIGVVTNITHEHLDYHGSYEEYFKAKAKLIEGLAEPKRKTNPVEPLAVLNHDDRSYQGLSALAQVKQVCYGREGDVTASGIENTPESLRFTAHGFGFEFPVETRLIGDYNVWNALAAVSAAVVGLGISPEGAQAGIKALAGVPGRMERISMGQDFLAIVDFAHTPFAIESALEAGRKMTGGRVIAVFGSAGLRDKAKRRMMAETSAQKADLTILTAEDPRTESLEGILEEMAEGARSKGGVEGETFYRVPDRGEAIRFALKQAQAGDLVLALGKGHEQSMCFIETEYPWDDRTAMRAALAEYLGVDGPQMPYLPTQED
jgi:UDP-N-acetylmuramoyl-L-alanyl-D-glutamate--2,6-diaminopimelate ligase